MAFIFSTYFHFEHVVSLRDLVKNVVDINDFIFLGQWVSACLLSLDMGLKVFPCVRLTEGVAKTCLTQYDLSRIASCITYRHFLMDSSRHGKTCMNTSDIG